MRAIFAVLGLLIVSGATYAEKETHAGLVQPARSSCSLGTVTHDWDFSTGSQGFHTTDCDQGGIQAWEYGATSYIPGAPARVWGTVLNGDYSGSTGAGLVSPSFFVDEQSRSMEIYHYYDTEQNYDGGNVSVGVWPASNVIQPIGGYTVSEISANPSYYAFCVDGEPGWTGESASWRVDCFDLSEYLGQTITLEFDFGSDETNSAPGWYIGRVAIGSTAPPEHACCNLRTGVCRMATQAACVEDGSEWHAEWSLCDPNPCPQPVPGGHLRVLNWFNAEPWHDWISGLPGSQVEMELHPGALAGQVLRVDFFYSTDHGGTWQMFGGDEDGYEPHLNTYDPEVQPEGDGWSAVGVLPVPLPEPVITFKSLVSTSAGTFVLTEQKEVDNAPPSLGRTNIDDWVVTEKDTMAAEIDPNGTLLERIIGFRAHVGDVMIKGVPGINQHIFSNYHCAPTAASLCLKYFEARGDSLICAGLNEYQLVGALGSAMQTNLDDGTRVSDWTGGMTSWVQDHGDRYTVRLTKHYSRYGLHTWAGEDYTLMRNELERCQDVLLGLFWPGGGGHAVTLDMLANRPLPDGRIVLGFKDPWTGLTSSGELDTETGIMYNVSGAGLGGAAYIGATMYVCPVESTLTSGGPGLPVYDAAPMGSPPYLVPVVLPEPGLWFVHLILVNSSGHASRITKLVVRQDPAAAPLAEAPVALDLRPIRPNPFGGVAEISYALPRLTRLTVQVFDVAGRTIRTLVEGEVGAGIHKITWDGTDSADRPAASGVYYVRMRAGAFEKTRSLTLVR